MTTHLTEDDLVLHFYGEMDAATETEATSHLAACDECRRSFTRLQRVLAAVDAMPMPALHEGFERVVWARLEPALPTRRGWLTRWMLGPANLVWAAAVLLLIAGAFYAGRLTTPPINNSPDRGRIRGRHPGTDAPFGSWRAPGSLASHVDRAGERTTARGPDAVDIHWERERAEELVAANRLYRQTRQCDRQRLGDGAAG